MVKKSKKSRNIPPVITGNEEMVLTSLEVLRSVQGVQLDARQATKHAEVQAQYLLHAGEHHAKAVKRVETHKQNMERHIAMVADQIRSILEQKAGGKSPTDKAVMTKVNLDPTVQAMQDKLILLEYKETRVKYLVEAMRHRKDMIFGLRLMRQDEMKSYSS
jgi:hypothetical protein